MLRQYSCCRPCKISATRFAWSAAAIESGRTWRGYFARQVIALHVARTRTSRSKGLAHKSQLAIDHLSVLDEHITCPVLLLLLSSGVGWDGTAAVSHEISSTWHTQSFLAINAPAPADEVHARPIQYHSQHSDRVMLLTGAGVGLHVLQHRLLLIKLGPIFSASCNGRGCSNTFLLRSSLRPRS